MRYPARILVAGDLNIDIVLQGDVVPRFGQAEQLLETAEIALGGSAGIVASAMGRLDANVALVAVVGDDLFGHHVLRQLAERGVDVAAVKIHPERPTGVSVILSVSSDRAILTLPGTISGLEVAAAREAISSTSAKHVHVTSFFLQPKFASELVPFLRELRAQGVTTSLDTNWDPADEWNGVRETLPYVSVFLPNENELRAIARRVLADPHEIADTDLIGQARRIAELGPLVVVKRGADGASAVTSSGQVANVTALRVEAIDATGAGDTFDAGFLTAWVNGMPLEKSLRWGVVAGSLSTRRIGGCAGQPDISELMSTIALGEQSKPPTLGVDK